MDRKEQKQKILELFCGLADDEKKMLLMDFIQEQRRTVDKNIIQANRRHILDNKQGVCPHCSCKSYVKFGIKSGSQRYLLQYSGGISKNDK